MKVLVTGSSGLIGSEAVLWFDQQGHTVVGVDNNMRADFFGPKGDTSWMLARLKDKTRFRHVNADIRDRAAMFALWQEYRPDLIIHCAAQPSHDLAATRPLDDFDTNAVGTVNLLEATRLHVPESVFILQLSAVGGEGNALGLRRSVRLQRYQGNAVDRQLSAQRVRRQ
jgi:CDP-paratose 2-epimerase